MLVSPWIPVFLGQAKVNDVHEATLLTQSHQKVIWLDVPMYKVFTVNILYSADLEYT